MGAAEQQYSLRWNDFHASILSSFRHLKDEEDFVDVTLACDGCSFTAHKVVLSACSPYFRRLLKANPCQHPIVILRDVKQKDMEALLRFMYNGEVHIGQEQLADFLKTAQTLQVRGLADVPTKENQKNSSTSESMTWPQSALGGSREHRDQDGAASPPPQKRSRNERNEGFSPSPSPNPSGEQEQMTRESLLGQALEGGGNQHAVNSQMHNKGQSDSSLQAHSTGDDSSTDDTANSEKCPVSDLVKSEPTDYENDPGTPNIEIGPADTPRAHSFPAALLGLQGMGLLPGPSGLHNSNQEANFGPVNTWSSLASGGSSVYECPLCDIVFNDLMVIRSHLEEHYPRDSSCCPVVRCQRRFTHPNSVRNHMRMKHPREWEKMKSLKWTYV